METYFNDIVKQVFEMRANEEMVIESYGAKGDLTLHIFKDEDFNYTYDPEVNNIVAIVVMRGETSVEDTDDIHIMDLDRELERIYYL